MTFVDMKKTEEIETNYRCEFCNRAFVREKTLFTHLCETKNRWLSKDKIANRIGFQSFVQFYKKHSAAKNTKTQDEFIRSPYYTAFVKFGNYCSEIGAINVSRFVDWLLAEQISIDNWNSDNVYRKYLIEYLRKEDPMDAIHRSVETSINLVKTDGILPSDFLRYCNTNKICHAITTGKISPWMLYQSKSGPQFLDKLTSDHVKMIIDYIDPEQWALKFHREPENVRTVKEILVSGGY